MSKLGCAGGGLVDGEVSGQWRAVGGAATAHVMNLGGATVSIIDGGVYKIYEHRIASCAQACPRIEEEAQKEGVSSSRISRRL